MAERKETSKEMAMHKTSKERVGATLSAGDLSLPEPKVSPRAFAAWVRALCQNWRQGTVACKGRAEVARSRKRPWRQKGTGRARVSSARSPLWRGGGVIFGPQPRTRTLKVPARLRQRVLARLMYELAESGNVCLLDFAPTGSAPKTRLALDALRGAQLDKKKVTLLVAPEDAMTHACFANIPNVQLLLFDQLNAYHLADYKHILVLQKDIERFKELVARWI